MRQISVDLKGINLSGADLTDSTLRDSDLTGAHFHGTKFIRTKMFGSDLSGSIGVDTKFRGAILRSAKLARAQFFESDLTAAQTVGADFHAATFFNCQFKGTHLYSANLVGADFMRSRPWTARLFYPPAPDAIDNAALEMEGVSGINDLLDGCRELKNAYGAGATLYFRGEGKWSWDLRPSVMRGSEEGGYVFRPAEAEMLNGLMTRQPDAFDGVGSALAQWVFAQHHGLKTRLLDVSRNPLVGLFNACVDNDQEDGKLHVFAVPKSLIKPFNSDTVRIISNFAKLPRGEQNLLLGKTEADTQGDVFPSETGSFLDCRDLFSRAKARLHAIIRQESPYFEEKIDLRDFFRVFVVEPQRMFERLKAQSGAFLVSAFHERFERDEVLRWNADIPIYAHHVLRVPYREKPGIFDELRLLNVTREVLLPSVDEAAIAVTREREDGAGGA